MLLAGVVAGLLCAQAPDPAMVEDKLRRARNEYAYGNYAEAIQQLRSLIYPMQLSTDEQVIEARKYLALSYYLTGKTDATNEEFQKLLYLSPDYELDPYSIAPSVIELFERVRERLKPELDAIRQRKSDATLALPAQQGMRRTIEQTLVERSEFATFMPFGIGQFQNGDISWGVGFLATEVVLLAANIGAYLWARSVGDYYTAEDRALVQRLTVAQYGTAALLGIAWSLGVFHARLNFTPIMKPPPVIRDEPLLPSGLLLNLTLPL